MLSPVFPLPLPLLPHWAVARCRDAIQAIVFLGIARGAYATSIVERYWVWARHNGRPNRHVIFPYHNAQDPLLPLIVHSFIGRWCRGPWCILDEDT